MTKGDLRVLTNQNCVIKKMSVNKIQERENLSDKNNMGCMMSSMSYAISSVM